MRLTNNGQAVIGVQVAEGTPTFADPQNISTGELTAYEAVMSAIPRIGGAQEETGRVHVLLPGKTVEVQTNGAPYLLNLTSNNEEIADAYLAQSLAHYAYSKVAPTQALISELGRCASGIGRAYAVSGEASNLEQLIREDVPRLTPCVKSLQMVSSLEQSGAAPAAEGADAVDEQVPSFDDDPHAPLFTAETPVPEIDVPEFDGAASVLAEDAAKSGTFETIVADAIEAAVKVR